MGMAAILVMLPGPFEQTNLRLRWAKKSHAVWSVFAWNSMGSQGHKLSSGGQTGQMAHVILLFL